MRCTGSPGGDGFAYVQLWKAEWIVQGSWYEHKSFYLWVDVDEITYGTQDGRHSLMNTTVHALSPADTRVYLSTGLSSGGTAVRSQVVFGCGRMDAR